MATTIILAIYCLLILVIYMLLLYLAWMIFKDLTRESGEPSTLAALREKLEIFFEDPPQALSHRLVERVIADVDKGGEPARIMRLVVHLFLGKGQIAV